MATETNYDVWPCPFCPPGTDHFERVSANGTILERQCAGCTHKHREPARGRSPLPLPVIDMEYDEIAGTQVVQDVWVCSGEAVDEAECPSTQTT